MLHASHILLFKYRGTRYTRYKYKFKFKFKTPAIYSGAARSGADVRCNIAGTLQTQGDSAATGIVSA